MVGCDAKFIGQGYENAGFGDLPLRHGVFELHKQLPRIDIGGASIS